MKKSFLNILPLLVAGVMLAACANGTLYNLINDSLSTTEQEIEDQYFEGESTVYSFNSTSFFPGESTIRFIVDSEDRVLYTGRIRLVIDGNTYVLDCSAFDNPPDELILTSAGGDESLRLTDLEASHSAGTITYSFIIPVADSGIRVTIYIS